MWPQSSLHAYLAQAALPRHMRSLQGIMVPVVPVPAAAGNQSNEFEEVMQSLTKLSLS